jgi:hypothetical protein
MCQVSVAHSYNPSYLGRGQEDRGSKSAQVIVRETLCQKTHYQKKNKDALHTQLCHSLLAILHGGFGMLILCKGFCIYM